MKPLYPRHSFKRYSTIKNSDTKSVEAVYLWFEYGDGEIGVRVDNVKNKKEAWNKYYSQF